MRLISTEIGQSIQLINIDEIRPLRGGAFLPDIIVGVAQRYRFVSYPREFTAGQELKFETGVMERGEMTVPIRLLQIFSDGFLVTTGHTDDADAVMADFMEWAFAAFQFREPITVIPRKYLSSLIADIPRGLDQLIKNFERCREIISGSFGVDTTHVARVTFSSEPGMPPNSSWQIEPRLGSSFDAHRYFSTAPLPTGAHVEMLAAMERALE
jgi:hypothetical protein